MSDPADPPRPNTRPQPDRIGPYRILELLGAGGMGEVYKAERREPVRQLVALKIVREGLATREVLARFDLERRALAAMNHRSIAKVLDAGATETGEPYFVMELVEGLPLTTYCDRHRLSLPQRLALFQQVCAAVQHAHQKGLVHRDLKPTNVLVTREGDDAVAKVLDFGLAKATNRDFLAATLFTERDRILGTPEYMAPEQAAGDGEVIDTRADVYSLGVMLYELLTGELPFPTARLRKAGALEAMRLIREEEPPRPSAKLTTLVGDAAQVASSRGTSVDRLGRELRGDLDWVVLRAMAKEPERRYETAAALAGDLQRYLSHEPVLAGPPSIGYRARKLLRKYRGGFIAASLLLGALLLGGGVSAWLALANAELARRERDERATAERLAISEAELRRAAQLHLGRFQQLRNVVLLQQARAAEATTWPAWPDRRDAIAAWLREHAAPLLAAEPELARDLRELEGRASAPADGDARRFPNAEDEFLHTTLAGLVAELADFATTTVARVQRRAAWAARCAELTLAHPHARITWAAAREALRAADGTAASALYRSDPPLELEPQCDLVPLGVNPVTRLWEFYHLASAQDPQAPPPVPDPVTGNVAVGDATGIVFVLVPGGTFWMGAQAADPSGPNHDPEAETNEGPPQRVTLAPYFLARHELTQAQYERLTGDANPSYYPPGWFIPGSMPNPVSPSHPVEQLGWAMASHAAELHGLVLPTEAQWEYACRAGTATRWYTGQERASLIEHGVVANIADRAALRAGATWAVIQDWPEVDDGWSVHAPVDAMAANPWGFHHLHGNVWEWCRDPFADYASPWRAGDGLRERAASADRVTRGGSFTDNVRRTRCANRSQNAGTLRNNNYGVRVARPLRSDAIAPPGPR